RHNTGVFEELLQGNLERECVEEVCDLEEARETFEDDEQTMEFWAGYIDGNQCKPNPCLNQGSCKDNLGSFTCTCLHGFTGIKCEIAKRCDVNNGDCMHFCETMGNSGAACSCATGYKLLDDGSCKPEGTASGFFFSSNSVRSMFNNDSTGANTSLSNFTSSTSPPSSTPPVNTTASATTTAPPDPSPSLNDLWSYNDTEETMEKPFHRIVGGEAVTSGEIPWQVECMEIELFCGGSILSQSWVITAAHCLVEIEEEFIVRIGEYNILIQEDTEQDFEVLEKHVNPLYDADESLYNHDIALLHLKTPITFSTTVRPICIGPQAFTEALITTSSPATVSGWGRMRYMGATSNTLQKVEIPVVDRTDCTHSSSTKISHSMFCAGYNNVAKDACQGDSGGPHANRIHDTWFLTGIVSWGEECAKDGKYGVYTRVSLYYNWINQVTGLDKTGLKVWYGAV
uniref:Coagulation factor IX n=1 Tax=Cynoglossus semilaevis TaxID=244447 RepID=A0A3P8V6K6_CYNSE